MKIRFRNVEKFEIEIIRDFNSIYKFCVLAEVTPSSLYRALKGEITLKRETCEKICVALDKPFDKVFKISK